MNPIILNNISFEPDTDKIADKLHIAKDSIRAAVDATIRLCDHWL